LQKKVNIDGKMYLVNSDGNYLKDMKYVFDVNEIYLYKSLVSIDSVVLDVGANIGLTSIFFAENTKYVHSFEPGNSTFTFLASNLKIFGNEKYRLHNFGFGSKDKKVELFYPSIDRASAFISRSIVPHSDYVKETVSIKTLDKFCAKDIQNFDFIKLDVEGFELEVLLGARKMIRRIKPVVSMEMNHFCLNAFQDISIPTFINRLRDIFPKLYAIEGKSYLDLHSVNDTYHVTWNHVVNGRYKTIVGAFHEEQIARFRSNFRYGTQGD
jgi:FkbM family methyltransferase